MTKRASLGAASVSAKSDGKSPTPTSTAEPQSPAPYQPQHRESQQPRKSSRRASSSLSPTRTLQRRGSGPHPSYSPPQDRNQPHSRLTSPLSQSSSPSATRVHESDEERGGFGLGVHPPPMSYSSTSTLSDSVVTTPAFAAFPLHAEFQDAFSPRTTAFPVVIESSTSTSTAGSEPPTRPSSPPDDSILPNKAHKYTANAPAPLKLGPEAKRLFPESNTSPLRINKRVTTSPPVGASQTLPSLPLAVSSSRNPSSTNDTPTNPPVPSSATPNTSLSFASSSYDHRSSADAQIGIGLSLLQDLANGMDSSDEDEDEADEVRRRLRYSRWSVHSPLAKDGGEAAGYQTALARVGHRTQDSMEDGTVDGLMYARSEDDEQEEQQTETTILDAGKSSPIPFTTSPQSALLSLPSSPISPSLGGTNDRERRPSLAASAASTGSWEGASDIYDDYRYSRFSTTSKVSTMSSRVSASGAASGVTPTPPVPESRSSMRGGESFRSRTDSAKSRPHSPLPQVLEADVMMEEEKSLDLEKEEMDDDGRRPLPASSKRSTIMKDRTMSMDSEASVYTQNSSRLSDAHQPSRPAPLNLTQQPSPLLHTSWGSGPSSSAVGSGFVYPDSSKSSSMVYTPVPGIVSQLQVRRGTADDAHGPSSPLPSPITPNFASAMRMKIEDGRNEKSGVVSEDEEKSLDTTRDSSGLGSRIVVEDEDELPSRILNSSFNDTASSTSDHTPVASRSSPPSVSMHLRHVDRNLSPSPEPVLQHRLAPLIVTNRTPSPSPSVAEMFPSEPPSPLVPTNPPPSDSSSTPPPMQILPVDSSSSTSTQQPLSHLRPPKPNTNGSSFPEQNRRRSIFQPHPNAPKPLGVVQGAQGIAPGQGHMGPSGPQPSPQYYMGQQGLPTRPHLFGVIRMALSMPPRPLPPQSQPPPRPGQQPQQQPPPHFRGPTIYGRTEVDLSAANGPVPMIWSVDPPPPIRATAPPPSGSAGGGAQQNSNLKPSMSTMSSPPRGSMMMAKPGGQQGRSMSIGPGSMALNANANGGSGEKGTGGAAPGISLTRPGSVQVPPPSSAPEQQQSSGGGVIPRANFFPKAPGVRPRSRSFSGFNTTNSEVLLPNVQKGKRLVSFLFFFY